MTDLTLMGERARAAARQLMTADTAKKNAALNNVAQRISREREAVIGANALDVAAGREAGLTEALIDRLTLDEKRIKGLADSISDVMALPDPVGRVLNEQLRPNGLLIRKVAVPIGVLAVIYEARPNVTVDSAALSLKSGNAVILRGGREAIRTNTVLASLIREALQEAGLPADCVQLIEDTSRESANALMHLNGFVDALIPRGGKGLIDSVVNSATVPVIATGAGVCHAYVDEHADIAMAAEIILNGKASRPAVCNSLECMLIHKDIARKALPPIKAALDTANVKIHGDGRVAAILPGVIPADDSDWGREYGDYIIAAKVVDSEDEAIEHIARFSTGHSEVIITGDAAAAERFMSRVDSAAVYLNASTRFTDGGEFGLGAEIGISTQKLHARGPLGLNELTSMKYMIYGKGQIR